MDCREAQSLIVPFVKGELDRNKAKAFFSHIDSCPNCRDDLEVYYVLLIGLKQLDDDTSGSLDLHGQFEKNLNDARSEVMKKQLGIVEKWIIVIVLFLLLVFLLWKGKEEYDLYGSEQIEVNQSK